MDIEKQVVSLDLCKKLKEAGYPQDSYYIWAYDLIGVMHRLILRKDVKNHPQDYPAPTVAEMGEKLPNYQRSGQAVMDNPLEKYTSKCHSFDPYVAEQFYALTEADARAKMWLYLKDKELL